MFLMGLTGTLSDRFNAMEFNKPANNGEVPEINYCSGLIARKSKWIIKFSQLSRK